MFISILYQYLDPATVVARRIANSLLILPFYKHCFDMSLDTLFSITANEDLAVNFLQQRHCIRRNGPNCSICDRVMTLVKGGGDKRVWRCPTHKSEKSSLRLGSFWENSHLPLRTLVRLAFLWSFDVPNKTTTSFTGLNKKTVTQWFQYFRDVCSHHLLQNPIMIGGPNVIVEVDESVIARRKYQRGHLVPERWVFGGICPDTQEGFLIFVPSRDAATLLPIIQQHVRPGSIIHTDGWAAYNGIAGINVQPPYNHQTVNHTINFVDPITGACTNHVENFWKRAKAKLKAMCGVQENFVESYLDEFLWRERFGGDGMEVFDNLLLHISQWYPTP